MQGDHSRWPFRLTNRKASFLMILLHEAPWPRVCGCSQARPAEANTTGQLEKGKQLFSPLPLPVFKIFQS